MITVEQIEEIKEKIAVLKIHLHQSLHEVMSIDEIDLRKVETITFEKANEIRKRFSRLKLVLSNKFNLLVEFFEHKLENKGYFKQRQTQTTEKKDLS
jgi:hypothetical protein